MRDIKFRGKTVDTDNRKWAYGSYLNYDGEECIIKEGTGYFDLVCGEPIFCTAYCQEVIPETIGQYTGLKDKKGIKIYEGDIVELLCGKATVKIGENYFQSYGGTENRYCICVYAEYSNKESEILLRGSDIEVIGNIYDNPELLEDN